ncbi:MAG: acetyl-CoA carboxylase biotin carboxyl carrier protein [Phycisphaerales bacterium]|nr:MAG: acetyl-CoA carboxylase biotin carboxyl carrier protein [Phycisphaerales bacterium]
MLDIDKIQKLIEMMVANDLVEISLRDGGEEVNLRRPSAALPNSVVQVGPAVGACAPAPVVQSPAVQPVAEPPQPQEQEEPADESELVEVKSPMVGTFYAASDPESPPFVKIGQQVQVGMVVCILEAMKVFNEIKSEVAGTIERVLVKNAAPVEFGQPLFLVRPL